jgi:predicted phosphodiesterase
MPENIALLPSYEANGLRFNIGSDFHLPLEEAAVSKFLDRVREQKREDVLFLLGDLFLAETENKSGLDASAEVNVLLEKLAKLFERIVFVPGNHDLRRVPLTDDPWKDLHLPDNVVSPKGIDPIVFTIGDTRILAANLGYDMQFIDPDILGLTEEQILDFYTHNVPDGTSFLQGADSISMFRQMTLSTACALTENIDILATHTLPHPSLVTFKVAEMTDRIFKLQRDSGLKFVYTPEEDDRMAATRGKTGEAFRRYWNFKSFFMGSDVLGHPLANPRNGLTVLYGHNHRGSEHRSQIRSREIRFITNQR